MSERVWSQLELVKAIKERDRYLLMKIADVIQSHVQDSYGKVTPLVCDGNHYPPNRVDACVELAGSILHRMETMLVYPRGYCAKCNKQVTIVLGTCRDCDNTEFTEIEQ